MTAGEEVRFGVLLEAHRFHGQDDGEVLARTVGIAQAAEAAGFDEVWVTEHHFLKNTVSPSALAMAAYLLGVTARIRVGTAVTLLPLHSPVHVAEQAALLDQLSGGRFVLGAGRGQSGVAYDVIGGGHDHWRTGLAQALDLTLRAFRGEVSASSGLHSFPPVTTTPRPRMAGGPPVYVAAGSSSTVRLAAERGLPMLLYFDKDPQAKAEMVAEHAVLAAEAGHPGGPYEHASSVFAHVTDEPRLAGELMRGRARGFVALQSQVPDPERLTSAIAERLLGTHPVGTPTVCSDNLVRDITTSGCRRVLCQVETVGETDAVLANVARLARDVFPRVRRELAAREELIARAVSL
ncbi:LLM class flavin-dependent oxidoreductase [Streptomyces sp. NPDC050433]|uniref:LLM class flavin-dependent oxidoreductase n=1 Tax=Streptomyces sp. NPDC050433 TaxID=3365615 RepID=UPI0037BC16AE